MRDLLRGHADRGGTVLLSSHLLHEIEFIPDDLVVIGHGHIVARGSKTDLLRTAGTLVRTPDLDGLGQALAAAGLTSTRQGRTMMLVGFTLGVLIRNSPGAIVAYFVYAFVAPTLATLLALFQDWFRDLRPWVDLQDNRGSRGCPSPRRRPGRSSSGSTPPR